MWKRFASSDGGGGGLSGSGCGNGWSSGILVVCDATQCGLDFLWSVLADESMSSGWRGAEEAGDGTMITVSAFGTHVRDADVFPILSDDRFWSASLARSSSL